jgi:hypothetical protein
MKNDTTQPEKQNAAVIDFIKERIADGGATVDQLQTFLHTLDPKEKPSPVAPE